jgi:hypothetical protein
MVVSPASWNGPEHEECAVSSVTSFPDGIDPGHVTSPSAVRRHASPLSLLLLGGLLAVAMTGLLGGGGVSVLRADSPGALLEVEAPTILRNGEFFEMTVRVTARRAIDDLVLSIEPGLLERLTQNSMLPAASDETFDGQSFRFSYGPKQAGETMLVKQDFQINPDLVGGVRGRIAVMDGENEMAGMPVSIQVRP